MDIIKALAKELDKKEEHVSNVVTLLDEGNTVPFIARYRKEMHGTMDDQTIRTLADRLQYLRNLEERKKEVLSSIEAQGKLTEELRARIENAETLAAVEDEYRPFKQKRRTRATIAREKGLEPLALLLFAQEKDCLYKALVRVLAAAHRTPEQLVADGQFLKDYVLGSPVVRAAVVGEYLRGLRNGAPPVVMGDGGQAGVLPPRKLSSIEEAGRLFLKENM